MRKFDVLWRLVTALVFVALVTMAGAHSNGGPSVSTDKGDYAPGSVAQISGHGWTANSAVLVQVVHVDGRPNKAYHKPFRVTADAHGDFEASWYVDPSDSLGASFLLTAKSEFDSGSAEWRFTDKNVTTTTIVSSLNPSSFGTSVTYTITVSSAPFTPAPTGTVLVTDAGVTVSTPTLTTLNSTTATATYTTSTQAVGSHNMKAQYNGDSLYQSSNQTIVQTVNKANTTTTVVSSQNPAIVGANVTFTATITGTAGAANPTGTATFKDGAATLGSGALNASGVATFSTSSLTAGSHNITVVYGGNTNYNTSTSSILTQFIGALTATSTALSSDTNPANEGATVTFTAIVTGGTTPTGTVTFKDGVTTLGSSTLDGAGFAYFATSSLLAGTRSITAVYGGDGTHAGNTSSALSQKIIGNTTISVGSGVNPSKVGQSVTFTATISTSSGNASGNVTFKDGATTLGTGALSSNVATFSTSTLTLGTHSITVSYAGDSNYNGSSSSTLFQAVNQASTTTGISSNNNPSVQGQSVTFTATVTVTSPGSGTATGTVTFMDGGSTLGTGVLSGNTATLATAALSTGTHTITAIYGGDANYLTSTSSGLSQLVKSPSTTISVASNTNPSKIGQSVTFTATVTTTAGNATGTVSFMDGVTTLGTGTLSSNVATFSTSALAVATHSITAVYGGDSVYTGSTSSILSQVVGKGSTSATVATSGSPSYTGVSVTFTATISVTSPASGTPTGTVTFKDGAATLGTTTLSGVVATFSTSALSQGNHTITATYNGDTSFNTSTSSSITQSVNTNSTPITINVSPNPANYGQNVTISGVVGSASDDFMVSVPVIIQDNGVQIGSTTTNDKGIYTFSINTLSAGSHPITTYYPGELPIHAPATSPIVILVINKATATVTLGNLAQTYTGSPLSATATTVPAGLTVTFTYNGSATAPTNVGSYTVVGTVQNINYQGSKTGTLVISKANQTITFGALPNHKFGDPDATLAATSSGGVAVTFAATSPVTISGTTMSFPASGATNLTITVTASAAADANHNAAPDATQSFTLFENTNPTSTATLTPTPNANGWNNTSVTVTIDATDNSGGNGIKEIHYAVDGGADRTVFANTAQFNVTTEGVHSVSYHAVDLAGNIESPDNTVAVKIDETAPTLTATPDRSPDSNDWYTAPVTVTFTADDPGGSGVDPSTLTAPITYTGPDSNVALVAADVSDYASNNTHTVYNFKYDATDPTILVTGLSGSVFTSVTLDISASDSGSSSQLVLSTVLKKNGTTVWTWSGTDVAPAAPEQIISGGANDGNYHLDVTCTDEAGHLSTKSYDFVITNSAPTIQFLPASPDDGGFYNSAQTFSYLISSPAGIASTVQTLLSKIASVDIGPVATTSGTTVSVEGQYTVHLAATDTLGRSSSLDRTFTIDTTPPTVDDAQLSGTLAPNPSWFESDVNVTISSDDPQIRTSPSPLDGSAVAGIYYYITGAQITGSLANPVVANGSTASFTINTEGISTVTYWAVDNAGNASTSKSVTVRYDETNPAFPSISNITVTATKPAGADVTFTLPTPTDNVDANPSISAVPSSGSTFGVGTTEVNVTATDDAGQTFSRNFTVTVNNPGPSITSISPNSASYGDAGFTMDVTGAGFMNNSVVRIDGSARSTTFVDFNHLQVALPSSDMLTSGGKSVTVFTPVPVGGTSNAATFTVGGGAATLSLSNLSRTYTGNGISVDVTTSPAGLTGVVVTYNGSTTLPVHGGSYAVVATLNSQGYIATPVSGTLVIAKADPLLTVDPVTVQYDGNPHPTTGTAKGVQNESLTPFPITYSPGGSTAPVNVGAYIATGKFTATQDYNGGTSSVVVEIDKATQTIIFPNIATRTFGAAPITLQATVSTGLPIVYSIVSGPATVSGSTLTITGAGVVTVMASQAGNSNYSPATAITSFTVSKATPTVTVTGGSFPYNGSQHPATGTVTGVGGANLGTPVFTYTPGGSTAPTLVGTYAVTGTFAGNANYLSASNSASITIVATNATMTLGNLSQSYTGTGVSVTVTTNPANISGVSVTYNGLTALPVHPGSYSVVATLNNPGYFANPVSGTLVIGKATPTIVMNPVTVQYDGNPHVMTATATGVQGENLTPVVITYPTINSVPPTNIGTYTVTAKITGSTDYVGATVTADLTITPRPLTVTADNKTKFVDAVNPPLTGTVTGAVPADGIGGVYSLNGLQALTAGQYTITTGISDPNTKIHNYTLTKVNGTLKVVYNGNSGPLLPIKPDGTSVFAKGAIVPIKVNAFNVNGQPVSYLGVVSGYSLIQSLAGAGALNSVGTNAAPTTTFQWSGTEWYLNLDTSSLTANVTYFYRISLNDGTFISVKFGIR